MMNHHPCRLVECDAHCHAETHPLGHVSRCCTNGCTDPRAHRYPKSQDLRLSRRTNRLAACDCSLYWPGTELEQLANGTDTGKRTGR
jgi:hypothetical protein